MPFEFEKTEIEDVIIVKPRIFGDNRGYFLEAYVKDDFLKAGIKDDFIRDNVSKSQHGVLRGLHYQKKPYGQSKLVSCIKGKILDVAVDIRKDSKTFLKYVKRELSETNGERLYIPEGFAHGFVVLSDEAIVSYKVAGGEYKPDFECGIIWNDSDISIDWGINFEPELSLKDKSAKKIFEINKEDLL